jgi:hypothetical protein
MKILTGEIEGRIMEDINEELTIKVGDNDDDLEYLTTWIRNNAPKGAYVIITVAVLEGV